MPGVARRKQGNKHEQEEIDEGKFRGSGDGGMEKTPFTDPGNYVEPHGLLVVSCRLHQFPMRESWVAQSLPDSTSVLLIDGHPAGSAAATNTGPAATVPIGRHGLRRLSAWSLHFTRSFWAGWPLTCAGAEMCESLLACILTEHVF